MTRGELLDRALKIIGENDFLEMAQGWLDLVLYDIESRGYWRFLEKEGTYQTQNNVNKITLTTLGILDYSKGITVVSNEPWTLRPLTKNGIDAVLGSSNGNPKYFSLWNDTVYIYPTPLTGTGVPMLTIRYFKEISTPANDTDDIKSVTGIKPKYHRYLVDGVIVEGLALKNDSRLGYYRDLYEREVSIMLKDNEDYNNAREMLLDKPSLIRTQGVG